MKAKVALAFLAVEAFTVFALDLSIAQGDVRIEQIGDGGYHLWVRKKADIGSILLTETTLDPLKKADNYSYRTPAYNAVNGDELRMLNGKIIAPENKLFSLIDSTPEKDPQFGEAFHIYIPWVILYGYAWSRQGEVYVIDGTFMNIRAFEKPFADYAGGFAENPYVVRVTQKPLPGPPEDNFMKETISSFGTIAEKGGGKTLYSKGERDIMPKIAELLETGKGKTIDLVLCLDTTESMQNDIVSLKKELVPMVTEKIREFKSFRIGMVLYKDYFEEYVTKRIDFTENFGDFQKRLEAIRVYGGRDIPEAVYEALFSGVTEFPWIAEKRLVILVGDAPPHPIPRGTITEKMVMEEAKNRSIEISVIILPE